MEELMTGVGALDLLETLLGLLHARRAAGRRAPVRMPCLPQGENDLITDRFTATSTRISQDTRTATGRLGLTMASLR